MQSWEPASYFVSDDFSQCGCVVTDLDGALDGADGDDDPNGTVGRHGHEEHQQAVEADREAEQATGTDHGRQQSAQHLRREVTVEEG